ncbi:hypothetical protein L2E82_42042 [Cichorium intybus]|uniref:Uncharacterized protein n=1 Tax=Cichorium intybus TaxID=13427 RepID=A0ACB8ZQS6_CICIN|nr:hypothetical protein L2E82_42042 [Cichorium intybus]
MDLKPHASGEYSVAVVQANSSLEDQGQVLTSPSATYIGLYDGHSGPEASSHLFHYLEMKCDVAVANYHVGINLRFVVFSWPAAINEQIKCQEYVQKENELKATVKDLEKQVDPYLNTDAATMSLLEHGEVFVLDDGGEENKSYVIITKKPLKPPLEFLPLKESVGSNLKRILDDTCAEVDSSSSDFWVTVAALKVKISLKTI